MRDGSGNPPDFSSGDCSEQPDPSGTQWKPGHAQKKSLLKIQKGLLYYHIIYSNQIFWTIFSTALPLTFLLKMVLDTNFLKKLSAFSENSLELTGSCNVILYCFF
jgi:hypothetical protein